MILCLDVGNSQIFGGLFHEESWQLSFRHATQRGFSSDQIGIFLRGVLRENDLDSNAVSHIAICSVVPHLDYSLRGACRKYFNLEPFVLQAGVKTGLQINYRNPLEVGADRITNAIAAIHHYPNRNLIVVDFGTATTLCAISAAKEYLGGVITAGLRISMDALQNNTAKLFPVEIVRPDFVIGRSTLEGIQAGLFYGQLGVVRELIQRITQDVFNQQAPIVIGTGGFAHLFEQEQLFTAILPDLVLDGLRVALQLNEV